MALGSAMSRLHPVAPSADSELADLVDAYLVAAREESEARKAKDAAFKKIESLMAQKGLDRVEVQLGNRMAVAEYVQSEKRVVDKAALLRAVGTDGFVEVATVSQSAVKEAFGQKTLAMVLVTMLEEPKLRIKEA